MEHVDLEKAFETVSREVMMVLHWLVRSRGQDGRSDV